MVTAYEFNWLLKGWVAMALVIFAAMWAHLGYNIAFFLAGLQTIPKSVGEAAKVDGAGGFKLFRYITFPLLSPVTFFLFIMNMVFSFFETFGIIHAVTQVGPGIPPPSWCIKLMWMVSSISGWVPLQPNRSFSWPWSLF